MLSLLRKIIYRLVGPKPPPPAANFPHAYFEVDNAAVSDFVARRLWPRFGGTDFPLNELHLLAAAICRVQPSHLVVYEPGDGRAARVAGECLRYFQIDCQTHQIDADQATPVETALLMLPILTNRCLFYLDGGSGFDAVRAALGVIAREHQRASILVHRSFFQEPVSGYNIGPRLAISAFLLEYPAYQVIETKTGRPGMTLLYIAGA